MADLDFELTFDEFREWAQGQGADEVLVREWAANHESEVHEHAFSAKAHVVRGKIWLNIDGSTRQFIKGDNFEINSHVRHSEKYGAEGATFYIARFN